MSWACCTECAAELAASGSGRVVLAFGEAGIGKTALLRQFCAEVPRRFTTLWGTCDPLFTPPARHTTRRRPPSSAATRGRLFPASPDRST